MKQGGKNGNICLFFAGNKENPEEFPHSWKYDGEQVVQAWGGGLGSGTGPDAAHLLRRREPERSSVRRWGGGAARPLRGGGGTLEVPL